MLCWGFQWSSFGSTGVLCLVWTALVKPYLFSGLRWKYLAGSDVGSSLFGFGLAVFQARHQRSHSSSFQSQHLIFSYWLIHMNSCQPCSSVSFCGMASVLVYIQSSLRVPLEDLSVFNCATIWMDWCKFRLVTAWTLRILHIYALALWIEVYFRSSTCFSDVSPTCSYPFGRSMCSALWTARGHFLSYILAFGWS